MPDPLSTIAEDKNEAAFRRLFEGYGQHIKACPMRRGADASTAEKLAQETMLTVSWKGALCPWERRSFAAWMFMIARNLRVDHLRRGTSWPLVAAGPALDSPSDDPSPNEAASDRDRHERVRAASTAIRDEQREAILLAFIDGLSRSKISERLKLPLGTVKSRMRLAYPKVRTAFEDLQ
jgi:RNA polymerase sigma-70 factor (ECF subfamily)